MVFFAIWYRTALELAGLRGAEDWSSGSFTSLDASFLADDVFSSIPALATVYPSSNTRIRGSPFWCFLAIYQAR